MAKFSILLVPHLQYCLHCFAIQLCEKEPSW